MKKTVIVSVDKPLSAEERRDFSKTHPGYRLCFTLRYPRAPFIISTIISLIAIIVSSIKLFLA